MPEVVCRRDVTDGKRRNASAGPETGREVPAIDARGTGNGSGHVLRPPRRGHRDDSPFGFPRPGRPRLHDAPPPAHGTKHRRLVDTITC